MGGVRWGLKRSKGGSPFDCTDCTDKDKEARNCGNHRGLSTEARVISEYTPEISSELEEKKASKVWSLTWNGAPAIRLYECPLSCFDDETIEIIRLCYLIDDTKQLLHPGGWGAQPAWLLEAYEILKLESAYSLKDKGHE